jgi:DNA-binding NarL/FixJ family response regulator
MSMTVRIAVLDPLPIFQRGIMASVGKAGLIAEAPEDLLAWSGQETRCVVFLTLESRADWQLMSKLRQERSSLIILAMLVDTSVPAYLRAMAGGATAAVPRNASPERLRQVFDEAVEGMSLLPVDVVRAMASASAPPEEVAERPTNRELDWLRELANGSTVARVAERSGYSERAMFRLLQRLYRRMGVKNRTEALLRAHQQRWL